jgi:transcriptional regulator with PAS, ATPase and Fis domain
MKNIFLQIQDPSGESRTVRFSHFPVVIGTSIQDKNGLRDSKLSSSALILEFQQNLILKSNQEGLLIRTGDLRFPAVEVPFAFPLKVGDTELVFFQEDPKSLRKIDSGFSQIKWQTRSESGITLLSDLKKASMTRLSIYLQGETGTGKELLAEQIHQWSDRAAGSFVAINCGALPVSLAESELFGHVKGAFTGASRDRTGAFLQAHNGTLFLDEVGDLPMELQVKLLRFLECGEIRPVGSDRVMHADVRVICATHKPLSKMVQEGKFRQDLYFRLASIPFEIPNLNSRPEDIRALSKKFAEENGKTISEDAIQKLLHHQWEGNVRELRHAVERACGLSGPFEDVLQERNFSFLNRLNDESRVTEELGEKICTLEQMEKLLLLKALRISKGNRTQASKQLGIARSTLFDMIKRHRIVGPRSIEYRVADETT